MNFKETLTDLKRRLYVGNIVYDASQALKAYSYKCECDYWKYRLAADIVSGMLASDLTKKEKLFLVKLKIYANDKASSFFCKSARAGEAGKLLYNFHDFIFVCDMYIGLGRKAYRSVRTHVTADGVLNFAGSLLEIKDYTDRQLNERLKSMLSEGDDAGNVRDGKEDKEDKEDKETDNENKG